MWYHKIVHWFFLRVRNRDLFWEICCETTCCSALFCLCIVTYIFGLLAGTHPKLATELPCLSSTSKKIVNFFVFFCFLSFYFLHASKPISQPTGAEDTYRPLTTVPFKIEVNNSSKYLPLPAYGNVLQSFRLSKTYNSLVLIN